MMRALSAGMVLVLVQPAFAADKKKERGRIPARVAPAETPPAAPPPAEVPESPQSEAPPLPAPTPPPPAAGLRFPASWWYGDLGVLSAIEDPAWALGGGYARQPWKNWPVELAVGLRLLSGQKVRLEPNPGLSLYGRGLLTVPLWRWLPAVGLELEATTGLRATGKTNPLEPKGHFAEYVRVDRRKDVVLLGTVVSPLRFSAFDALFELLEVRASTPVWKTYGEHLYLSVTFLRVGIAK